MGALIKACNKGLTIKNTGSTCNESMGPTAMLFAVPPGLTWDAADLADFTTWLQTQIHAPLGSRIYPLFGPSIPIRKITNNKEADVIATQDDGTQIFIRYGVLNRAFSTTEGGLCFMQALQSLTKAGYSIIEVDNAAQVMFRKNTDLSYSAQKTTFMYSPSPDLADFKTPGYSNFQVSITPEEYVNHSMIFQADDNSILDLVGLQDTEIGLAAAATTTKLKISVKTECAETDLVALLGADLAQITNFIVKLKSSGAVQTITAAGIVSGHIELTGTFTSAGVYTVQLAAPDVLFGNDVEGYGESNVFTITIP